eukprot:780137-Pyramimonas_sp.AAC.1
MPQNKPNEHWGNAAPNNPNAELREPALGAHSAPHPARPGMPKSRGQVPQGDPSLGGPEAA